MGEQTSVICEEKDYYDVLGESGIYSSEPLLRFTVYSTSSKMAELNTHVNIKEKIYAVRSVVPNKSNNEIVLVLQQFDFNVDKAVQAFVDGSAVQVLKEWNMTGKKKNNKRKRSKSKQHQGNKDAKDKAERPETGPLPPPPAQIQNGHVNGCDKDSSSTDSANEKPALTPREKKISILEEPSKALRGVTEGSHCARRAPQTRLRNLPYVTEQEQPCHFPFTMQILCFLMMLAQNCFLILKVKGTELFIMYVLDTECITVNKTYIIMSPFLHMEIEEEGNRLLQQKLSLDGNCKTVHGTTEGSDGLQWSAEQLCNPSKPKAKTSPVKSNVPAAHLEIKPDELAKKRGPNIEKSVKDLQRCTVSLTRYRVMIKEEVDSSVKKIKAAFAELHNWLGVNCDIKTMLVAKPDSMSTELQCW
ncbi:SPATS2-like protein [Tupaia chinensis]|uniref:SPATS2-like protein n=1 Tax=Tupaia chinensis TaxID=246437 RepID=L9KNE4_TUPCH|nr:SPATS2-like protein [Tupaia chinensis]